MYTSKFYALRRCHVIFISQFFFIYLSRFNCVNSSIWTVAPPVPSVEGLPRCLHKDVTKYVIVIQRLSLQNHQNCIECWVSCVRRTLCVLSRDSGVWKLWTGSWNNPKCTTHIATRVNTLVNPSTHQSQNTSFAIL